MKAAPPRERFEAALASHGHVPDPAQKRAIESLDKLAAALQKQARSGLLESLKTKVTGEPPERHPVTGLYLWGGVGRGKTFLMDIFFHAAPFADKQRMHFHRFMRQVHAELKTLKDTEDPLRIVAARIARKTRVICFDEFFVSDIGDAMLLGRLFEWLFRYGVTLVATSNVAPDDLYRDGLQRTRFLPAIAAIKSHCEILNVDAGIDYRLRALQKAEIWHAPLDETAELQLESYFSQLNPDKEPNGGKLDINGRNIPARKLGDGVAWFDFAALCEGPRAAADYIEVAQIFHTVLISHVPVLDWQRENEARRFITLVDEFYDRQVKLIVSAEKPPEETYQGERLKFEFQRTLSRLREMQSQEYLALPHKA